MDMEVSSIRHSAQRYANCFWVAHLSIVFATGPTYFCSAKRPGAFLVKDSKGKLVPLVRWGIHCEDFRVSLFSVGYDWKEHGTRMRGERIVYVYQ